MKSDHALLQSQFAQLDSANRAWQQFFDDQQFLLKKSFEKYLDLDENSSFEDILRRIVEQLEQNKPSNGVDRPGR